MFSEGFDSFEDLEQTRTVFSIEKSRTAESYNTQLKKETSKIPKKFVYQSVKFVCKHSNPPNTTSTGERETCSFKKNCQCHLSFAYEKKVKKLVRKSNNLTHNHDRTEEIYEFYPENRGVRKLLRDDKLFQTYITVSKHVSDRRTKTQIVQEMTNCKETPKAISNLE